MVAKDHKKNNGSPKAEVGEIDTSSPFQSVKDAVSLFGEGAFSGEKPAIKKPNPQSAERVLAKESELHLAQKQLNKLKEQLKNAETTKLEALSELEKAKRTVEDVTHKLKAVNESKDLAIRATELANHQAKQFAEVDNDYSDKSSKIQYIDLVTELNMAKQELRRIRQVYNESIDAKNIATKQADEAEDAVRVNMGKVDELSKKIGIVKESIQQVKLANAQTKDEEKVICADKEKQKLLYKKRLDEMVSKLLTLKKDIDPEVNKNLEAQLGETLSEIEALKNEMCAKRNEDFGSVKTVTLELGGAKESLSKVVEEESSLRSLVESLKLEMDNVKKQHLELKEKECETESIAGNLHVKLRKIESLLEVALLEEGKVRGAKDEMIATIHQLSLESVNAKREAEEMKQKAEELKGVVKATRIELEEAENKLKAATYEAEEAKAAEIRVLDQIKALSEKADVARASSIGPEARITISRDEFDSLSRKVDASEKLAEMKVSAAMAQVEAVKASEDEALKRYEAMQKEIEEMKSQTREALKKAEMAEAAKNAVEGELRRWREREQKKAVEKASRIIVEERGKAFESPLDNYGQSQRERPRERVLMETRKMERAKTYASKKVLMPSLSGVFRKKKKKNKVEGGSPSYLPGEKPVW